MLIQIAVDFCEDVRGKTGKKLWKVQACMGIDHDQFRAVEWFVVRAGGVHKVGVTASD